MKEFLPYLPTLITTLIVVPCGIYLQTRLKNLANSNDFVRAVQQLEKNTEAVESIKGQLSEKYWVKQQIWDTKRVAYEEILSCLYLTKEYIDEQVAYLSDYTDSFIYIGSSSYDFEDEEYQKSYEEHVNSEQQAFREKYESQEAISARQELSAKTKNSFKNLESVFSIKSIYLDPKIGSIETLLGDLKHKLYDAQPEQDDHEDTHSFLDRLIGHHMDSGRTVDSIIILTKNLAMDDLKLSST
ncbi:TPA: hypothetical protein ACX6Q7_002060 [Photobacterium damselae]